jgi:predicted transcriptional regulator of viral defense system
MDFRLFQKSLKASPVFSTRDIEKLWGKVNPSNLINWQDKGYIIRLRNDWYAFPENLTDESDLFFIANRLQRPSYISLETALRFYNFIPESVFSITSLTTLKPDSWSTPVGHFVYRSIKPSFFFGYCLHQNALIADPEKTLLDTLYFKPELAKEADFDMFRFNQYEIHDIFNKKRMETYLKLINSQTLEKRWRLIEKRLAL